jgi:hypothetical protein
VPRVVGHGDVEPIAHRRRHRRGADAAGGRGAAAAGCGSTIYTTSPTTASEAHARTMIQNASVSMADLRRTGGWGGKESPSPHRQRGGGVSARFSAASAFARQSPALSQRSISWVSRFPSHRVVKFDCVVVEQKPARTIVPRPKRFPGSFSCPKRCNRGPEKGEQSDWRSIERSRRHRARISGYHGRSHNDGRRIIAPRPVAYSEIPTVQQTCRA